MRVGNICVYMPQIVLVAVKTDTVLVRVFGCVCVIES